jgi:hypothetical protein
VPTRLEEAVAGVSCGTGGVTRERVPLQWAATQMNLGNALWRLGQRESGTARLEEAMTLYDACPIPMIVGSLWPSDWVHRVRTRRDEMLMEIERRKSP